MDGHADRRIERDGSQRDRVDRLMERERERVVDRRKREDKGGERRERESRETRSRCSEFCLDRWSGLGWRKILEWSVGEYQHKK